MRGFPPVPVRCEREPFPISNFQLPIYLKHLTGAARWKLEIGNWKLAMSDVARARHGIRDRAKHIRRARSSGVFPGSPFRRKARANSNTPSAVCPPSAGRVARTARG